MERSLGRTLRREPLPKEAMDRIRARVAEEFQREFARPARAAWRTWLPAVAAAVVLVIVGAALRYRALPQPGPIARVVTGHVLQLGERWEARGPALMNLTTGGMLRMAEGTVVEGHRQGELALRAGRVYLDFPEHVGNFRLLTDYGVIEHVGTQFEVAQVAGRLRVRVREGLVLVHNRHSAEHVAQGMQLLIEPNGGTVRGTYPPDGSDWSWVETVTPRYLIEDRPLAEFLNWVARETGRRVLYLDSHAKDVAAKTRLHGSVEGLRPTEALDEVLNTTSLDFDLSEGAIRIGSRS